MTSTTTSTTTSHDHRHHDGDWHEALQFNTALGDDTGDDVNYMTKDTMYRENRIDLDSYQDAMYREIINRQKVAFNPEAVGSINWDYLHTSAFRYAQDPDSPTEDEIADKEEDLYRFFDDMHCEKKCVKHIMEFSEKDTVKLNSRADFVWWTWRAHNEINRILGKRYFTKEEFMKRYVTDLGKKVKSPGEGRWEMVGLFITVILVLLVIVLLVRYCQSRGGIMNLLPHKSDKIPIF